MEGPASGSLVTAIAHCCSLFVAGYHSWGLEENSVQKTVFLAKQMTKKEQ